MMIITWMDGLFSAAYTTKRIWVLGIEIYDFEDIVNGVWEYASIL